MGQMDMASATGEDIIVNLSPGKDYAIRQKESNQINYDTQLDWYVIF